ncbi:hypothetical protein F4814DRAFT_293961 [Daldinia grandis]|nr:hypothetical protein F4814DRAFT_293961 [Daldinia grandis]
MKMMSRLLRLNLYRANPNLTYLRGRIILSQPFYAPFTTSSVRFQVVTDQTKKSNDPEEEQKEEHHEQATKAASGKYSDHPAKQPDPQPSPSKSTGIRSEGPGSKSGEGPDPGVHKEKGAGAGQHLYYSSFCNIIIKEAFYLCDLSFKGFKVHTLLDTF